MNSSITFSFIIFLFVLSACNTNRKDKQDTANVRCQLIGKGDPTAQEQTLITVKIGTSKSDIEIDDVHLHGKFFDDRAEFFVVEQPLLYLGDTKVEELTLYFIDGVLCKKKYELEKDISSDLMKTYGTFKFKALNDSSKVISKQEGVLAKGKKRTINNNLTYYRMKWPKNSPLLYYEYKRDSAMENRFLIEELASYKILLRQAELSI